MYQGIRGIVFGIIFGILGTASGLCGQILYVDDNAVGDPAPG